jgi:hypothetical protein
MKSLSARWIVSYLVLAAVAATVAAPLAVRAQATGKSRQPAAARMPAAAERPPRELSVTGRVVTVHAYMTGQVSEENAKIVTDGLRAGGAPALETPNGLVILGQGNTSGVRALLALANQEVEVHGRMYEKAGVKFLDFDTVHAVAAEEEEVPEEEEEEEGDE